MLDVRVPRFEMLRTPGETCAATGGPQGVYLFHESEIELLIWGKLQTHERTPVKNPPSRLKLSTESFTATRRHNNIIHFDIFTEGKFLVQAMNITQPKKISAGSEGSRIGSCKLREARSIISSVVNPG